MADRRDFVVVEAEAEKFRAEARQADAEARKAGFEADVVACELEVKRIQLDREREKRQDELAENKHHFVYHFTDGVSGASAKACMTQLDKWTRAAESAGEKCRLEIVFSSPGGSVIDGMALWDHLQAVKVRGHHLTTSTIGYAASMAGILLQAGDVRAMGREAYILVHEISFGAGGKIGEVEDEVAFVKKIQSRVLDIFAARTNLTKGQIDRRWKRKDWWLDSSEALKLGFVDEVR